MYCARGRLVEPNRAALFHAPHFLRFGGRSIGRADVRLAARAGCNGGCPEARVEPGAVHATEASVGARDRGDHAWPAVNDDGFRALVVWNVEERLVRGKTQALAGERLKAAMAEIGVDERSARRRGVSKDAIGAAPLAFDERRLALGALGLAVLALAAQAADFGFVARDVRAAEGAERGRKVEALELLEEGKGFLRWLPVRGGGVRATFNQVLNSD